MIKILIIILLLLMIIIGGERGVISIITLAGNIIALCITIYLIVLGINPLIAAGLGSLIICAITLIYQNKKNKKTIVAFISALIIIAIFFTFAYLIGTYSKLGGFNEIEQPELMTYYLGDIHVNMVHLEIAVIIIGLLGAITDTAMAVSSGLYEVYQNNQHLERKELFLSGMNIGKDILGTTVNTLLFAYLGESVMLFILFKTYGYTFLDIINSKSFLQSVISILFSAIGCVAIIPLTALLEAEMLKRQVRSKR